jgi:predicted ATPase
VQLFVERVTAIVEDFTLTDANTQLVVRICRRLDGLPLAIELAAPGVEALGVEGLAARLDVSLRRPFGAQRRAAVPRHRTMQAVIDWSYRLLSEDEQRSLRTLGVFAGGLTAEAVAAISADVATPDADAIDRLADLVTKSLVVADVSGAKPRFRLLDTTRAYAIQKLDESGERQPIAQRHARHYRDLFQRAEVDATARPSSEWLADYTQEIDNLRAALDWTFSSVDGDISTGIALTAAAAPVWMYLSLIDEWRFRIAQAITALGTAASADAGLEFKLQAALQAALGASSAWIGCAVQPVQG